MKIDLDALMQANDVDVLLVLGPAQHNPAMVYLTGGGHVTHADLIKKRGEPAVLFHGPMERDEAARTGLATISYSNYPLADRLRQANGDMRKADVYRYQQMFRDVGVTRGRVMLAGLIEFGEAFDLFSALQAAMPEITFCGDPDGKILLQARATKDGDEIERIRRMGRATTEVVAATADFLSGHTARGDVLVRADGEPLTIGDVKRRIDLWLAERGAENPEGTIFAIGRDAGVPHSSGTASDVLRLGQTIVYDIFPCEAGGGYFYDFTRTWCLGYAPDEALALYEQVYQVYRRVTGELKVNQPCSYYQRLTCELFEAQGHATILSDPATEVGYVHSLGHGLGLNVHELPGLRMGSSEVLTPGMVTTVEPGLYYPERGLGVRLEDTYWVTPQGKVELLAEYPYDLVLPVGR